MHTSVWIPAAPSVSLALPLVPFTTRTLHLHVWPLQHHYGRKLLWMKPHIWHDVSLSKNPILVVYLFLVFFLIDTTQRVILTFDRLWFALKLTSLSIRSRRLLPRRHNNFTSGRRQSKSQNWPFSKCSKIAAGAVSGVWLWPALSPTRCLWCDIYYFKLQTLTPGFLATSEETLWLSQEMCAGSAKGETFQVIKTLRIFNCAEWIKTAVNFALSTAGTCSRCSGAQGDLRQSAEQVG